jgi:hypothetical protein
MAENTNSPKPNAGEKPGSPARLLASEPRLRAVWPLLKFHEAMMSGREPMVIVLDGREVKTLTQLVEYVAEQQRPPVSAKTIWQWLRRVRENGPNAFADRPRSDKGKSRVFRARPDAALFVMAMFWEGARLAAIHREISRLWPELSNHDGSRAPSRPAVSNYLNILRKSTPEVQP